MRALLFPILLICGACWTDTRPGIPDLPPPTVRPEPTTPPVLPVDAATATPSAAADEPLPPLLEPLIRLHEVEGATPAEAAVMLREAPDRIEACRGVSGGVVKVHMASRQGKVTTSLRSAKADPKTTQCILDAIAFDQDEATSFSNSPSGRTRDVASMVTISW